MAICVYPGSFDPITVGHLDLIERAAALFDQVVVAVLHNPAKSGCFTVEERVEMIQKACGHLSNVTFDHFDGLLVDYMHARGAKVVLRGVRGSKDFDSEMVMAQLNHQMAPDVETLFMATSPEYAHISSSAVREIAAFGGDFSPFVPQTIVEDVSRIMRKSRAKGG